MNKYIIVLLVLMTTLVNGQEQNQGIEFFQGTFEEAMALASSENKKIFIDVYTTWCAPCKKMTKEVFPDEELGLLHNANFISIKIDAEKGEGIQIAQNYKVGGYPTLIYADAEGETIEKMTSYLSIKQMLSIGNDVLKGDINFDQLQESYVNESISHEELFKYITALQGKGLYDRAASAFEKYFSAEIKNGVNKDMLDLIFQNIRSTEDEAFQYLVKNKNEFYEFQDKIQLDSIIDIYYVDEFMYMKDVPMFEYLYFAAKEELSKKVTIDDDLSLELDHNYYYKKQNEDKYMETGKVLFDKHSREEDHVQISYLVGGAKLFKKPENVKILLNWSLRAVEIEANSINLATLGAMYAKLNNREKAKKYYDDGIAASLKNKDDYHEALQNARDESLAKIVD